MSFEVFGMNAARSERLVSRLHLRKSHTEISNTSRLPSSKRRRPSKTSTRAFRNTSVLPGSSRSYAGRERQIDARDRMHLKSFEDMSGPHLLRNSQGDLMESLAFA